MLHILQQIVLKELLSSKQFLKVSKNFTAIAVVGNKEGVKQGEGDFCAPCAVCRQVMAEFCDLKTFKVIIAKSTEEYLEYTLEELLPLAFTGKDLD